MTCGASNLRWLHKHVLDVAKPLALAVQVARASRPLSRPLVYQNASNLRRQHKQVSHAAKAYTLVVQVARASRPLSKPLVYRGASNLRRLYEQADMPDRLVVIGDSLCSFNPVRPLKHLHSCIFMRILAFRDQAYGPGA